MALRVVPVLDLKAGQAVHAVRGHREAYRRVQSVLIDGADPVAIARAYRDQLGLRELYVADLDAIAGRSPCVSFYTALDALGISVWVDAGLSDATSFERLERSGVGRAVVGLETIRGPSALASIVERRSGADLVFSLDLRAGVPVFAPEADWPARDALGVAHEVIRQGVRRLLIIDLARVGAGEGVGTEALVAELLRTDRELEIGVGGGIRSTDDLKRLEDLGASVALVGSMLHDGRLGRAELDRFRP